MSNSDVIDEQTETMLQTGVCEPSTSLWVSNVVLLKKSDGTIRFCFDYRQLKSMSVIDSYPLPRIATCFDALGGIKYFSTLDLKQGYWQVWNDPETANKTTFITRKKLPSLSYSFGLSNAPPIFQRLMNLQTGVCEPSTSLWVSNVVLLKKSDGTIRFCFDNRQLKSMSVIDSYPLPRIDTCLTHLEGSSTFLHSTSKQGYWQIENDPETANKTTFITRKKAFKFELFRWTF